MWVGTASVGDLDAARRWTVSFFSSETISQVSAFPMVPLKKLVIEKKAAVDPQSLEVDDVNYLGLENIRSQTGELVDFAPRKPIEIKSRSKVYELGDVLFGRLRPELNKVYLPGPDVSPGICSTEFIVLQPIPGKLTARYLRYALASSYVAQFAQKLRSGASLPRMNASDLLDLPIPAPPIEFQEELSVHLERLDLALGELRRKVEQLPEAIAESLLQSLQNGENRLQVV